MRRFLFVLVLILLVPTEVLAASHEVHITEDGFQPSEITISQGDTVTFINNDNEDHWPASDPHPTHQSFKQFDPKSAVAPGKSWQMQFEQPGTFAFHDHLFPHSKGTITVTKAAVKYSTSSTPSGNQSTTRTKRLFNPVRTLFAKIIYPFRHVFDSKEKPIPTTEAPFTSLPEQAQYGFFDALQAKSGSAATWQFLKQTFRDEAGSAGNIHDLAHYVGTIMYQKDGFAALSICTPEFAFGCFHGFLDTAFRNDLSNLGDAINGCAKLGTAASGPYASCIHGIGHGIASFYRTANLEPALKTCDNIPIGSQFCHDGVFMEFNRNASKAFYKPDDYLYPCNSVDEAYVPACGRNQPSVLLSRFALQFADAANVCAQATNEAFRSPCIDGIGFIAASRSFGDANKILTACKSIADEALMAQCAEKAAGELIFQNHPNWKQASFAVCDQLTEAYQSRCRSYLETIIKEYSRS